MKILKGLAVIVFGALYLGWCIVDNSEPLPDEGGSLNARTAELGALDACTNWAEVWLDSSDPATDSLTKEQGLEKLDKAYNLSQAAADIDPTYTRLADNIEAALQATADNDLSGLRTKAKEVNDECLVMFEEELESAPTP